MRRKQFQKKGKTPLKTKKDKMEFLRDKVAENSLKDCL